MSCSVTFPLSRDILWDRTPCTNPMYMLANEIMPNIYLSNEIISNISNNFIENKSFYMKGHIKLYHSQSNKSFIQHKTKFCIKIDIKQVDNDVNSFRYDNINNDVNNHELTIPFTCCRDNSFKFDENITFEIMNNLNKSLQSNRDFSLKSFIRIRACGNNNHINDLNQSTVRVESLIPNISFQIIQIRPLSICSTALSKKLFSSTDRYSGHVFGYATMNQTRGVIPLLESDNNISICPIIGPWIYLSDDMIDVNNIDTFTQNPLVWSACVKFIYCDVIKDRVLLNNNTFLLIVISSQSVTYWEVACINPNNKYEFICLDFTVDLSNHSNDSQLSKEPIICTFRPITKPDYIQSFRQSTESLRNSLDTSKEHKNVEPYDSFNRSIKSMNNNDSVLYEHSKEFSQLSQMTNHDIDRYTPQPRSSIPKPSPTKINQSLRLSKDSSNKTNSSEMYSNLLNEAINNNNQHSESTSKYFPAQIVLAQQIQIDELRRQVYDLTSLVKQLLSRHESNIPNDTAAVSENPIETNNLDSHIESNVKFELNGKLDSKQLCLSIERNRMFDNDTSTDVSINNEKNSWKPLEMPKLSYDTGPTRSNNRKTVDISTVPSLNYNEKQYHKKSFRGRSFLPTNNMIALRVDEDEGVMMETGINVHRSTDSVSSLQSYRNYDNSISPSSLSESETLSYFNESDSILAIEAKYLSHSNT